MTDRQVNNMGDRDKFRGCLIGGAAGDALGYAVEFMREGEIFSRYGAGGITEYALRGGKALISDDTQMMLFTATGLLAGQARGNGGPEPADIWRSYLDWLLTQEKKYPLPGEHHSWLVNVPELFSPRAPGNTCMSALYSGRRGTIEEPLNRSRGCGGAMRVAPVGLYFSGRPVDVKYAARFGADAAAVTHGHILGWMPAGMLAQIIHEIIRDSVRVIDAVLHALDTAAEIWPETDERGQLIALIEKALDLAGENMKDTEAIHQLGEGWVGDEALAIAVYCAVKYEDDFDKALIAAVNHNGDSDSTGAVAGNILGAKIGLSGIPQKYTENLELKDLILDVADDLYRGSRMSENDDGHTDPVWVRKYIEMSYHFPDRNLKTVAPD